MKKPITYTDEQLFKMFMESKAIETPNHKANEYTKLYKQAIKKGVTLEVMQDGYDRYMAAHDLPTSRSFIKPSMTATHTVIVKPKAIETKVMRIPLPLVEEVEKMITKLKQSCTNP